MTTINEDKNRKLKADTLSFKGELVEEGMAKGLDPSTDYMKNNPLKSPPNNITNKDKTISKG